MAFLSINCEISLKLSYRRQEILMAVKYALPDSKFLQRLIHPIKFYLFFIFKKFLGYSALKNSLFIDIEFINLQ